MKKFLLPISFALVLAACQNEARTAQADLQEIDQATQHVRDAEAEKIRKAKYLDLKPIGASEQAKPAAAEPTERKTP